MGWVVAGCCHTESALKLGYEGKSCFATHEGRICQTLDRTDSALILSANPIPNPAVARPQESISIACGRTVALYTYNNTCANETEISISGEAGGSVDPVGTVNN